MAFFLVTVFESVATVVVSTAFILALFFFFLFFQLLLFFDGAFVEHVVHARYVFDEPEAESKISKNLLLGCALAEGTAIFGFVVGLLIVVMLG